MPGVQQVTIDFDKKEAIVKFDANKAKPADMAKALEGVGYSGSVKSWPKKS